MIYWNKLFYFCTHRELGVLLKFMLFQSSHNILLYSNKNNIHIKFKKKNTSYLL